MTRVISRVAVLKSEEKRMESLLDPATLGGLDENDPRSVERLMKRMGSELGEELGEGFEDEMEEAARFGRRLVPKEICKRPLPFPQHIHPVVHQAYDGRRLARDQPSVDDKRHSARRNTARYRAGSPEGFLADELRGGVDDRPFQKVHEGLGHAWSGILTPTSFLAV